MTTTDVLNWVNVNNPSFLNKGNNVSVISAEINNPFVKSIPSYSDFSSADPVLNSMLPGQINLGDIKSGPPPNIRNPGLNAQLNKGITSPGTLNNAYECPGLDFTCNGTSFDNLTFGQCLEKFGDQYKIPEMTFNNLINSLPFTFEALSDNEKNKYIQLLQNFIDNHANKNNKKVPIKENFTNVDYFADSKKDCKDKSISVNGIFSIVIIVLLLLIIIIFIFTKKT